MQDSRPGQYQRVLELGLDGGDESGMWMLNDPFPYSQTETASGARDLADAALAALSATNRATLLANAAIYLDRRRAFLETISEADRRYYEFQAWKEGVARWTELAVVHVAGQSGPHYLALASARLERLDTDLGSLDLPAQQRSAFYALGSAEAEMLEPLAR